MRWASCPNSKAKWKTRSRAQPTKWRTRRCRPCRLPRRRKKQMRRNKTVGAGKQYAPTLYTVLVNADDDERLFGYYPTLAGETETYLSAKAAEQGLVMDGQPLVRFIVDEGLRHGKFDVVAGSRCSTPHRAAPRRGDGALRHRRRAGGQPLRRPRWRICPQPQAAPVRRRLRSARIRRLRRRRRLFRLRRLRWLRRLRQLRRRPALRVAGRTQLGRTPDEPGNPSPAQAPQSRVPQRREHPRPWSSRRKQRAASSPAPSKGGAALIDTTHGKTFPLSSARQLIGRESNCDIVIPDINASRTHAELRFEQPGVWVLTDLGSTNGTLVNGRRSPRRYCRAASASSWEPPTFNS